MVENEYKLINRLECLENKLRQLRSNSAKLIIQIGKLKSSPDKQKEFKLISYLNEKSLTNLNNITKNWGIKYSRRQNELTKMQENRKKTIKEIKKIERIIKLIKKSHNDEILKLKEQKVKKEKELREKELEEIEKFYEIYGRNISDYDLNRRNND